MMDGIAGLVAPGYEPVADVFAHIVGSYEGGASLCAFLDGAPVLDLWGGCADMRTGRPWSADTITTIFSCTKGVMSLLAARLVQEGCLDYDAPVSRYWPEFATAGKERTLVRDLLAHRAGLVAPLQPLSVSDIVDWRAMTALLAAQAPLWPPGEGHSYHFITHGWLVGEVLRRVTGKPPSELVAEMLGAPLAADIWVGLPEAQRGRLAHIEVGESFRVGTEAFVRDSSEWIGRGLSLGGALPVTLASPEGGFNDWRVQSARVPGAGGISNARALAKIWSAAVTETDGVRLLDDAIIQMATRPQSVGAPLLFEPEPWMSWGMGFQIDSPARRYLTPMGFGHDGAGGQVTFAEPGLRLSFAFITNQMEEADPRAQQLMQALARVPEISRRLVS